MRETKRKSDMEIVLSSERRAGRSGDGKPTVGYVVVVVAT